MFASLVLPLVYTIASYAAILIVYRLFFHPLAAFPGPRLAALTTWYEGYIDISTKGRFTFFLADLHKKYGPIIRIGPNEVHVLDSSYYNTLYAPRNKLQKFPYFYAMLGNPESMFPTVEHDLHKMRRGAVSPFFSAGAVANFSPRVQAYTDRLCARMKVCGERDEPIPLFFAYRCLTVDIIAEYLFGKDLDLLNRQDWGRGFYSAWRSLWEMSPLIRQLPWLPKVLEALPRSITAVLSPEALEVLDMQAECGRLTAEVLRGDETSDARQIKTTDGTVIDKESTMIWNLAHDESLPCEERTFDRIRIEANNVLAAGFETTGGTLAHMTYYILHNKAVHKQLYSELLAAIPDPAIIPNWQTLEKLPYLRAVVRETLRMTVGAYSRLSRRNPDGPMVYRSRDDKIWTIPAGCGLGMSSYYISYDAEIFPDPWTFNPERWFEADAKEQLDPFMTSFGKGSRACVGQNLAYAELYGVIATIIRRFPEIRLWETTQKDVEVVSDYFAGNCRFEKGRPGLQVKVE